MKFKLTEGQSLIRDMVLSFAEAEVALSAGSDVGGTKSTAVRDGSDWLLNGTKVFITTVVKLKHILFWA